MSTKNSENDYNSENMQEKVKKARKEMSKRFEGNNFLELNRDMNSKNIEEYVFLEADVRNELNIYATKLKLSPRSYHRVIKVARTIADLEEKENIEIKHILEALQYRPKINN